MWGRVRRSDDGGLLELGVGVLVEELEVAWVVKSVLESHRSDRASRMNSARVHYSQEDHTVAHHERCNGAPVGEGRIGMPDSAIESC